MHQHKVTGHRRALWSNLTFYVLIETCTAVKASIPGIRWEINAAAIRARETKNIKLAVLSRGEGSQTVTVTLPVAGVCELMYAKNNSVLLLSIKNKTKKKA